MKKTTRTELICRKILSNGQIDMFRVVVLNENRDTAKKNYESQGYTVTVSK